MTFNSILMMYNFTVVGTIIMTISVMMGVGMVLTALFEFKRWGEVRGNMMMAHNLPITGPVMKLLAGSGLLVLPAVIQITMYSLWGITSPIAYTGVLSSGTLNNLMPAIILFVRLIGVGSMIRGVVLLSRTANGQSHPGNLGKAMTHIFGGVLCVNVVGTYNLLYYLFFG